MLLALFMCLRYVHFCGWLVYRLDGLGMNESSLSHHIQLGASEQGTTLFRNQTGRYQLKDGRWLSSGLCIGSSDLIGWTSVEVTQEMVGKKIAVFTAVEVKSPDVRAVPERAQKIFLDAVERDGGIAMCVNNLETCMQTLFAKTALY